MQATITTAPKITITEADYHARQEALTAMPTAALKKECKRLARELAVVEREADRGQASGEDAYALQCLRDFAEGELACRVNGYTGAYEAY